MNKIFNINPHRGYLNTKINIQSANKSLVIVDDKGNNYHPGSSFLLSAGEHQFSCRLGDKEQVENVYIEDAVKLGGSKVKCSAISEKSSWIIVVMLDRTYFYNKDTDEQYVENNFTPDYIKFISSDLVQFSSINEDKKTLFSLLKRCPILSHDELFIVDKYIVTNNKSSDKTSMLTVLSPTGDVLNEIKAEKFKCTKNQILCHYDDKIFVYGPDFDQMVKEFSHKFKFIDFIGDYSYISIDDRFDKKWVYIHSIGGSGFETMEEIKYPICSINGNDVDNKQVYLDYFSEISKNLNPKYAKFTDFGIKYSSLRIYPGLDKSYYFKWTDYNKHLERGYERLSDTKYIIVSKNNDIINITNEILVLRVGLFVYLFNRKEKTIFLLKDRLVKCFEETDNSTTVEPLVFENQLYYYKRRNGKVSLYALDGNLIGENIIEEAFVEKYGIVVVKDDELYKYIKISSGGYPREMRISKEKARMVEKCDNLFFLFTGATYINVSNELIPISINDYKNVCGISESKKQVVFESSGNLFYATLQPNGLFENYPFLGSIFDKTSIKNAMFVDDNASIIYSDENNEYWLYNSNTNKKERFISGNSVKHINGYRPIVKEDKYRRTQIVDPVTMQIINPEYNSQYDFVSPDGRFYVENIRTYKYRRRIKANGIPEEISEEEFKEYRVQYNIDPGVTNLIERVKFNRRKFWRNNIDLLKKIYKDDIKDICDEDLFLFLKNGHINSINIYNTLNHIIEDNSDFVAFLFEKVEYVIIRQRGIEQVLEICFGEPLWFLNYVSFSYDSKKIMIVGRYHNDSGKSGLILIYNLEEQQVEYKSTNTYAVWTCAFTKEGVSAAYSGYPTTFLFMETTKEPIEIYNRNFLAFSPSGKYMALSNQRYVPYSSGVANWGHQPTSDIFINSVDISSKELLRFKDHGYGISGTNKGDYKSRTENKIAMVAFTQDDKKLMSVSDDGVVVIRNLHFPNEK